MAMELEDLPPLAFSLEKAVRKSDELDKKRRGIMPGKGEDAAGSAGPGEAEQVDQDFVSAVAKLLLWNTQLMRDVVAVTFVTMIVDTDTEPVARALARGQQYHEIVTREGKEHKRGPPHVIIFKEYVDTLVSLLEAKAKAEPQNLAAHENGVALHQYMNGYNKLPLEQKITYVKIFKIQRVRAEGKKKLIMNMKTEDILKPMIWASETLCAAEVKYGTMPKTNLERQVQQHIDRMGKKGKKGGKR